MTNPAITALLSVIQQEELMSDTRTERLEGYCDGMAGKCQHERSVAYLVGCDDGVDDVIMLDYVQEWKRRNAIAPDV